MALQGLVNRVMRGLLRLPIVSRGIGKALITLYVVGRTSGRRFTIPVAYTRHDGKLLIGSPFPWVRNLRTGVPLEVRYKGRLQVADVEVISDEEGVVEAYREMCRDNPTFAKFNKVTLDADGTPNVEDLHAAWRTGARVVKLSLR